jgi:hypothetical protein
MANWIAVLLALAALAPAPQPARADDAKSILPERNYVELEPGFDGEFVEFWGRFRAAVTSRSREALAPMVAFPLEVASQCLYEDGFSVERVFVPEVIDALATSTTLATSETPEGKVYAAYVRFRDADEGDVQQFEFARTASGFQLVRVGVLKVTCPARPPKAEPARIGPASPPSAPPAGHAPAPQAGEQYREPPAVVRWFRSNRELILILGFFLY